MNKWDEGMDEQLLANCITEQMYDRYRSPENEPNQMVNAGVHKDTSIMWFEFADGKKFTAMVMDSNA